MSGAQSCSNPPILNPSSGAGHVQKLGGLDSYVSGSPNSNLAVLLVTDIFGYETPNVRKLADKIAAAGFFVAVPDFLHGDPYPNDDFCRIAVWLKDHGTDKVFEEAKPVIEDVGRFTILGNIPVVTELAKFDNFIQAAALLYPTFVTVDDIKEVKVPIAILGAEIDNASQPELVKQFEDVLSVKPKIDYFVKIYPGVGHGWTVRYNTQDEAACKPADEAHKDFLEWFTKHVK